MLVRECLGYEQERNREQSVHRPNENKMSDGGRDRASLGVEFWKSSQMWSVQRSAVRSIAWLDRSHMATVNYASYDEARQLAKEHTSEPCDQPDTVESATGKTNEATEYQPEGNEHE
jgi:hypothetical protein